MQSSRAFANPPLSSRHLSVIVVGLVLLVAILKADKKDIPEIVKILFESKGFTSLGWFAAFVILLTTVFVIRFMMKFYEKELNRVCGERDELQTLLLKQKE